MQSSEVIMEILEAFDLTGRAADRGPGSGARPQDRRALRRAAGSGMSPDERPHRAVAIDPFLDRREEWAGALDPAVGRDGEEGMARAATDECSARGSPSQVCGCSSTGDTDLASTGGPHCCSAHAVLLTVPGRGPGRDRTLPSLLACLGTTLRTIGGASLVR